MEQQRFHLHMAGFWSAWRPQRGEKPECLPPAREMAQFLAESADLSLMP